MPRKTESRNASDWMLFVRADLAAVRLLAAHQVSYHVCRSKLAEALEKAIKASLIRRGWRLEKVHDLQKLCDFLAGYDQAEADALQGLVDALAESYTESRYPGFDLDKPDWRTLCGQMVAVTAYAKRVKAALVRTERTKDGKTPLRSG